MQHDKVPKLKGEIGTMPESAECKYHSHIESKVRATHPVAAHGKKNIIFKPGGERDAIFSRKI